MAARLYAALLLASATGSMGLCEDLGSCAEDDVREVLLLQSTVTQQERPSISEPPRFRLFPDGQVPVDQDLDEIGPEAFVKADPTDPVAAKCAPGDNQGYWYYNVSVPELVPFERSTSKGAVIVFPGGGFQFLAWQKEGTSIAKWLNSIGFDAYVLKYRIPGEETGWPDGQRAVRLVRHRRNILQLPEIPVGVIGFSAGGNLAARVSTSMAPFYAKVDEADEESFRPDFALLIYGAGPAEWAASAPPTFIAIAEDDQCVSVNTTMAYYNALKDSGIEGDLHIYHEGHHGYGDCSVYTEGDEPYEVCAWTKNANIWLDSFLTREPKEIEE